MATRRTKAQLPTDVEGARELNSYTGMLLKQNLRVSIQLTRALCIYMELSVVLRVSF